MEYIDLSRFMVFVAYVLCMLSNATYKLIILFLYDLRSEANKYTPEELSLMKTQDIGYVLQKLQIEKKVISSSV